MTPPTMYQLAHMSLDEKIEMCTAELEDLNEKCEFPWRRRRKEQLRYALESYWIVKRGREASNAGKSPHA